MAIDDDLPVPLLRGWSSTYDDLVCDAAVLLIADEGLVAFNSSRIARRMQMTPPALVNRYGNGRHLFRMVVDRVARRWTFWLTRPRGITDSGPPGWNELLTLVPETEEERATCRTWAAVRAFALLVRPGDEDLVASVDEADAVEQAHVVRWAGVLLEREPDRLEVELVVSCARGLRERTIDPSRPLDLAPAREALLEVVRGIVGEGGAARSAGPPRATPPRPGCPPPVDEDTSP